MIERKGHESFRVGVAEMNGWRNNMEDAHLIHMRKDWGFFGVFDGHSGDKCSKFVAPRIGELLDRDGMPRNDPTIKQLILGVDKEFLDTEMESGSTATMCLVKANAAPDGKHELVVINAGDSRVLLGRMDGSIVDGGGNVTDQGGVALLSSLLSLLCSHLCLVSPPPRHRLVCFDLQLFCAVQASPGTTSLTTPRRESASTDVAGLSRRWVLAPCLPCLPYIVCICATKQETLCA